MSDEAIISVKSGKKEITFYAKYQGTTCLMFGVAWAIKLHKNRPNSYADVFTEPKRFEPKFFEFTDEEVFGGTFFEADLRSEEVSFDSFTYFQAIEDKSESSAKALLLKLLPYYSGEVPETASSSIKSDTSFLEEFWVDGEISERYSWLAEELGVFKVPFSKLGALRQHL